MFASVFQNVKFFSKKTKTNRLIVYGKNNK